MLACCVVVLLFCCCCIVVNGLHIMDVNIAFIQITCVTVGDVMNNGKVG